MPKAKKMWVQLSTGDCVTFREGEWETVVAFIRKVCKLPESIDVKYITPEGMETY